MSQFYLMVGSTLVGPFEDDKHASFFRNCLGGTPKTLLCSTPDEFHAMIMEKRARRMWSLNVRDGKTELGLAQWVAENPIPWDDTSDS